MEAPITRTCKRLGVTAATLALLAGQAIPASALPLKLVVRSGPLSTYVEARAADALGDEARSAVLFSSLAAANRNDHMIGRRAVSAAIGAGSFDLALTNARAMPTDQIAIDARLLLVADALRHNRLDQALALINDRTAEGDGGFLAPLLLAWSDAANGHDPERALTAPAVSETLMAPFLAEQRAYLLLSRGNVAAATPLITEALARAGGRETRLRLAFAEGLRAAGDTAAANALLAAEEPALRRYATAKAAPGIAIATPAAAYAELLEGIAVTLAESQQRSLPIALAQIARLAAPDSSEARIVLALLLERDGRPREALATLAGVPANDPFATEARDTQARLLVADHRPGEAVALARLALTTQGADASPQDWARLGNALDSNSDHAGAAEAFARAAARADATGAANRWTYRLLRADQLEELHRWPEARAELRTALALAPDQPLILNFLGYGELERGEDLATAEAMIRKASALRPDDAAITDSLGWALYKRGRLPEAIETLTKAATASPAEAEIHEHLGDALFTAGRRLEARFAWRAALVTAEDKAKARLETKLDSGLTPATAAP